MKPPLNDRIEQLGLAAEEQPDSPVVWLDLAEALLEMGAGHPARHILERARGVAGRETRVWNRIGAAFQRIGDFDEATESYRQAASADPGHGGGEVRLGLMLLANGEPDAAEMEIRAGLHFAPEASVLHIGLARALEAQRRYALALVHAERATRPGEDVTANDLLLLAQLQAKAGHADKRLDTIARLRTANPDDPVLAIEFGFAALALGKRIEAESAFEDARQSPTLESGQLVRLGQGLRTCGAARSALAVLQAAARAAPQSGEVALELALTFEDMEKPADAIEQYSRALSSESPPQRAQFYFGRALMRVGRHEEASTHLLNAAAAAPRDDEIRGALADVLAVLDGRTPEPPTSTELDLDLAVFSIAELIEFLAHQHATGVLTLASKSEFARVILVRGRLLRCAPRRAPPLFDLLSSVGAVRDEGGASDLRRDDADALRYVVDSGSDSTAIARLLLEFVVEGLVQLLDLRDGRASFVNGPAPQIDLDLLVDPHVAILEAARRKDERAAAH